MAHRWRLLIFRSVIAALVAWIFVIMPIPFVAPRTWVAFIQVPIVVFILICYIGMLLIDTFFFDRFKS